MTNLLGWRSSLPTAIRCQARLQTVARPFKIERLGGYEVSMRFVQFCYQNRDASNLGVELTPGGEIVDLIEVRARNLIDFINGGSEMVERAKR